MFLFVYILGYRCFGSLKKTLRVNKSYCMR